MLPDVPGFSDETYLETDWYDLHNGHTLQILKHEYTLRKALSQLSNARGGVFFHVLKTAWQNHWSQVHTPEKLF